MTTKFLMRLRPQIGYLAQNDLPVSVCVCVCVCVCACFYALVYECVCTYIHYAMHCNTQKEGRQREREIVCLNERVREENTKGGSETERKIVCVHERDIYINVYIFVSSYT